MGAHGRSNFDHNLGRGVGQKTRLAYCVAQWGGVAPVALYVRDPDECERHLGNNLMFDVDTHPMLSDCSTRSERSHEHRGGPSYCMTSTVRFRNAGFSWRRAGLDSRMDLQAPALSPWTRHRVLNGAHRGRRTLVILPHDRRTLWSWRLPSRTGSNTLFRSNPHERRVGLPAMRVTFHNHPE